MPVAACEWPAGTTAGWRARLFKRLLSAAIAASQVTSKLDTHAPWVVKDPRLCLSYPLWLEVLDAPMCVLIFKNPREVGAGLLASGCSGCGSPMVSLGEAFSQAQHPEVGHCSICSPPPPLQVAYRLSLHFIKSFQNLNNSTKVFTAPLHVEAWANYTLSALNSCKGRPTIIFPSTMLSSRATLEIAVAVLYKQLVAAGG